jgi:hypothetical protein
VMVFFLALVAGCDKGSLLKVLSSPADEKVATYYIDLLRDHQFAPIEQDMDPSLQGAKVAGALAAMANIIPPQAPISMKLVGANTLRTPSIYKTNYTFEYQYPDRWLLINVATLKKGGVLTIVGFNVRKLPDSLENINRFTLAGKQPLQYAVLVAAVLIPLFCIYVLVLCAQTPIPKRKWLWIIFILLGFFTFSINWTTGQWGLSPISFQLLGVACTQPLYGAWIVSISLPVGAIVFLTKRKGFLKAAGNKPLPPQMPKANV